MKHHADSCGSKTNLEIAQQNIENECVFLYIAETRTIIFKKHFALVQGIEIAVMFVHFIRY